uniref:PCI domain-containing protein n=1 Tax=Fagus sylvatica TaxID=28930 RepID=A0A2N9EZ75_FAGSY
MDPKLTEVSQLFQRFKAAFVRNDFDTCATLLSQLKNRIAEFHTELELLSPTALENPCIKHAVELEQSFMEGAYNRVLSARQTVPHETYVYFMDLLAKTVRDEIAGCGEKAYDYLSINDARQMLLYTSEQELLEYIKEEHSEWEIKNGSVFFQKAKESAPCKEIPSLQLINQTLSYARELERIVLPHTSAAAHQPSHKLPLPKATAAPHATATATAPHSDHASRQQPATHRAL